MLHNFQMSSILRRKPEEITSYKYKMIKIKDNATQLPYCNFISFWSDSPQWARASSFTRFLDHTQRRTTVGRTPLDVLSARRKDLYFTTYTTLTTQKRPWQQWHSNPQSQQTYALDRTATVTDSLHSAVLFH